MKQLDALPQSIRAVEAQILDRRHLDEPLLRRDQREAVVYLQRAYAHSIRDQLNPDLGESRPWFEFLGTLNLAFDQAIRWAMRHCSSISHTADWVPDFLALDAEASQLIAWSVDYVKLSMDHTAASRQFYTAAIDEDAKVVSFAFAADADYTVLLAQLAAQQMQANTQQARIPNGELSQLYDSWVKSVELSTVRTAEDLPNIWDSRRHSCFDSVKAWLDTQVFSELDETTSLGDFTVGDLRKFWTHLYIATRMMTDLELAVDKTCGPDNQLGSFIIEATPSDFCAMLSESWGLTRSVVSGIVALLTFDPTVERSALNSSVFLQTTQGMIYLVCWKAQLSDPGTVTSRALARKSKKTYDALITTIEQQRVADVATRLEHCGLVSIRGRRLQVGESVVHPDFWLYEPLTSTLVACDYKHALPPFGPGEVSNRLSDLNSWFNQIRKYTDFVSTHASYVASALRLPPIERSEGLILFRWAMPIPATSPDDIILADLPTLLSLLDGGIMIGVAELRRFFQQLRHVSGETAGKIVWTHQDIAVGEWIYRHPVIALDCP